MGNCFSDPSSSKHSKPPKGGQRLGSGPPSGPSSGTAGTAGAGTAGAGNTGTANSRKSNRDVGGPPRTLGDPVSAENGGEGDGEILDPRERALKAAEERAKSAQKKGVTGSNPKAGKLSAQLAAERKAGPTSPKQQGEERMMDRGEWN